MALSEQSEPPSMPIVQETIDLKLDASQGQSSNFSGNEADSKTLMRSSRLLPFGAHFGAQKMIFNRFASKKRPPADRSNASAGLTFLKNGAKETRTPDPLHAMQFLVEGRR